MGFSGYLIVNCSATLEMITFCVLMLVFTTLETSLARAQGDICSRYGLDINLPGASCADIHNINPTSHGRSGYYVLKTDHLFFAYCDMELDCGGTKGGWMRIADIDTSRGDTCPSGWNSYNNSYCTGGQAGGCHSAHFSTNSTSYSKVCGKVWGFQKGSMDAFYPSAHSHGRYPEQYTPITSSRSLDGVYVDGISITSGNPRKHVWTYAVGLSDHQSFAPANCPCAKHPGPNPPTYVGNHYYCESGDAKKSVNGLRINDILWDGAGCPPEDSCCCVTGMPWFFHQFPITTTGDIEVRICYDEGFANEAVVVEQIQLYAQ